MSTVEETQITKFREKWRRMEESMTGCLNGKRKIWSVDDDEDSYMYVEESLEQFMSQAFKEIREDERERLSEIVKSVQPNMPDEVKEFIDDYDDYVTGIMDAKNRLIITLSTDKENI